MDKWCFQGSLCTRGTSRLGTVRKAAVGVSSRGFNKQGACNDWTPTGGCSECAPWCDCARAARRTDVTRAQVQRGAQMQRSALVQRRTQYRCTYVTTAVNNVLE